MRCPTCDLWNGENNTYCVECGTALFSDESFPAPVEEISRAELQETVYRLQAEVGRMQEHLSRNRGVLGTYERSRPARRVAAPPASESAGTEIDAQTSPASPEAASSASSERDDHELRRLFSLDWEMVLGGNWLARIGILAVVIGVGFFLKLAFDNNWIEDAGRVALGVVGGLALLGGGEYISKRYPIYSQSLSGGGVAILYLTIFAAFAFYGFIGAYPAIGLLFLVSATSAALALRRNSMAFAVIAVLGAFSAPFVIGMNAERVAADAPADVNIMLYVIIVDLGVLALSAFRNWRWLTLLALMGSALSFIIWYAGAGQLPNAAVSLIALTAVFLIFAGATTLFHVIWRRAPNPFDYSLMALNAAAYLALSYLVMWDDLGDWMGAFAFALALFYALLAYAFRAKVREQPNLARMAVGVSAVALAVAAPAQFDGNWVGASWAAQGAALIWLSFRMESWQQRLMGAVGLGLSLIWTLDAYGQASDYSYLLDGDPFSIPAIYALQSAIVVAAFFAAAYLDRRHMRDLEFWKVELFPAPVIVGSALLALAIWMHLPDALIAAGWAAEALALVWVSHRLNARGIRIFGWVVFALLGLRLLYVQSPDGYILFFNLRLLMFATAIAALYAAALLSRRETGADDWETYVPHWLAGGANALSLWFLSFETMEAVDRLMSATGDTFYAKSLALSLVWALYASVGLALGILRRWRIVRLASLCLLAVPIVKLFLFDSFALEQGYRVAAFLSLGAILLAGGFLYQRYGEAIRGFLFEGSGAASEGDA